MLVEVVLDEEWIEQFIELANRFVTVYGGPYTVYPSYCHVQYLHGDQKGISVKVPGEEHVTEYATEINRRLAERKTTCLPS